MKRGRNYWKDLIEDLKDPRESAAYLNAALEEGNKQAFLLALKHVVEAQGGMSAFAKKSGLSRVSLYKIFSKKGNPEFGSLLAVLKTLGIDFKLAPSNPYRKAA